MVRPRELTTLWQNAEAQGFVLPTVEFYGHSTGAYRAFSNFHEHAPFAFTLPASCRSAAFEESGRPACLNVTFTEKAIMLCKAAVMGDIVSFDKISRAKSPGEAKALGRQCRGWDESTWQRVVCEVAREAVTQKFTSVQGLSAVLLSTDRHVIAEMTSRDQNWGTGLDVGHPDASRPWRWRGSNILGWALMEAREQLRRKESTAQPITANGQDYSLSSSGYAPAHKVRREREKRERERERER